MRRPLCSPIRALPLLLVTACSDARHTDSRFATPERTVRTLLQAHGIAELGPRDIERRAVAEGGFTVVDREAYEGCFVDRDQPGGDAMAGYVFGVLAGAGRDLRFELVEQRAYVQARDARIVMQRGEDGAYRIVLADSVPEDLRRTLLGGGD